MWLISVVCGLMGYVLVFVVAFVVCGIMVCVA
jgi:hypothetical protein